METQSLINRLQNLHIQVQNLLKENTSLKEALDKENENNKNLTLQLKNLEQDLAQNLEHNLPNNLINEEESIKKDFNPISALLTQTDEIDLSNEKEKENLKSAFNQQIKNIDFCISFLEKNNKNT